MYGWETMVLGDRLESIKVPLGCHRGEGPEYLLVPRKGRCGGGGDSKAGLLVPWVPLVLGAMAAYGGQKHPQNICLRLEGRKGSVS